MVESPATEEKTGFDLKVHYIDDKTRRLVKEDHYLRHCAEGKPTIYERNGKFQYETGEEVPAEDNHVVQYRKLLAEKSKQKVASPAPQKTATSNP